MGNQFIASARELRSNHDLIFRNITGGDLQKSRDWQYIIRNGPLYITAGYRNSLDGMVRRTWDGVTKVNRLGIALLAIEGGFFCFLSVAWSWVLLQVRPGPCALRAAPQALALQPLGRRLALV